MRVGIKGFYRNLFAIELMQLYLETRFCHSCLPLRTVIPKAIHLAVKLNTRMPWFEASTHFTLHVRWHQILSSRKRMN